METDSGQRAMLRRREGARGRRERRLRAEARIRLQLCREAVRIASHRGGEGWQSKTSVGVQTAREEESDEENYAKGQKTPPPAGTQHFTLDDDDSVRELGGSRPDRIATLPGPQEWVQQHPVDQIVDTAPALPILDVPVPRMGEQLVDVLRFFDTLCPVSEQVIDVPKIFLEVIPS